MAIEEHNRRGVNIIVDDVIFDRKVSEMATGNLTGLSADSIGILSSREIAEARETARGDRVSGLVAAFHPFINVLKTYDFTVGNTLALSKYATTDPVSVEL